MARFILRYRTYNYINKNPVIDKVRTLLQDEGMFAKKKRSMLHQLTGVSTSTYDGWFEGDTKNPQHATIAATVSALGYEEKFVKTKELDMEKELDAARNWMEKQKREREKAKGVNGTKAAAAKQSSATKTTKKGAKSS
jgi:hypothetical protein